MRIAGNKTLGEKNLHRFTEKSWTGVVLDQGPPFLRLVAGLFFKFPLRAGQRVLARFELAGGQLPEKLVGRVAILAFDHDPGVLLALRAVDSQDQDADGV